MTRFSTLLPIFLAASVAACTTAADTPEVTREASIAWHELGSWSGRGHRQTESYTSDASAWRVNWETTNAAPTGSAFVLTIHSAISGRPLEELVSHEGAGKGTAYFSEDPRVFHAVIDSTGLDWTFTIEEAVVGSVARSE
ncbi:MAG: hypothetical protein AB7F99_02540 [Vicinamibacterales bacterium]